MPKQQKRRQNTSQNHYSVSEKSRKRPKTRYAHREIEFIRGSLKRVSFIKGLGASILFGIVAIGLGGLLTVTVIGGIIGIPMIFIGGIAILLSPFMFLAMSEGNCPYCQHQAIVMNGKKVVKCRSCKKRFSIRDGALYRIPT